MFTTEIGRPQFFPWIIQQFAVPMASLAWAWIVSLVWEAVGKVLSDPSRESAELIYVVSALVFGPSAGFIIHTYFPEATRTGRWIWILPMSVFLGAIGYDLTCFPPSHVFREFFWPGPSGEAKWAAMLIAYPTWSCVSYSLAVTLATRRAAGRFRNRPVS